MSREWWRKRSSATWRAIISIRVRALENELRRVPRQKRDDIGYQIARRAAQHARRLSEPADSLSERLLLWWSGARIEQAWATVREGSDWLVTVQDDSAVTVQVALTEALLSEQFRERDPRRKKFETMIQSLAKKSTFDANEREQLRLIRVAAHSVSDNRMRDIRRFRNLLFLAASALTFGLAVIAIAHAIDPDIVSLCASAGAGGSSSEVCLDGSANPGAGDLFEVEAVGAVGGLLAALLALGRLRRPPGPYSLPTAQGLLKAPAGAATALIGVLLLQSGALAGLEQEPGSNLIAYAALFGFAQQLLTTLVDQQANQLAESTPGGDATPQT